MRAMPIVAPPRPAVKAARLSLPFAPTWRRATGNFCVRGRHWDVTAPPHKILEPAVTTTQMSGKRFAPSNENARGRFEPWNRNQLKLLRTYLVGLTGARTSLGQLIMSHLIGASPNTV